jgi:hypothetical protein
MNLINMMYVPKLKMLFEKPIQIISLYFFIFQPPVISRSSYFIIELVFFLIYFFIKPKLIGDILKYFKSELLLLLIILVYVLFRDLLKGENVFFFKILSFTFQCFLFPVLIVSLYFKNNKFETPNSNLINISFWAIVLAGFSASLLLFNTSINEIYNSLIVQDMNQREVGKRIFRGFGVSENLTFTFSYLLGFGAGYTLYTTKSLYAYFILIPLFLLGVVVNARIGFIPIFAFILLLIFSGKYKNILIILFTTIIIINIIPHFSVFDILILNQEWISLFFIDIFNVFSGSTIATGGNSTITTLFTDFVILPNSLMEWFIGSGENLFLRETSFSDVGFIIQLFYGGLFFTVLLVLFIFQILKRITNHFGLKYWFTILLFLTIFILNIKGSFFVSTPGSRYFMLLYVYLIYSSTLNYFKKKTISNEIYK